MHWIGNFPGHKLACCNHLSPFRLKRSLYTHFTIHTNRISFILFMGSITKECVLQVPCDHEIRVPLSHLGLGSSFLRFKFVYKVATLFPRVHILNALVLLAVVLRHAPLNVACELLADFLRRVCIRRLFFARPNVHK